MKNSSFSILPSSFEIPFYRASGPALLISINFGSIIVAKNAAWAFAPYARFLLYL